LARSGFHLDNTVYRDDIFAADNYSKLKRVAQKIWRTYAR